MTLATTQCSGMTMKGERCKKKIRPSSEGALAYCGSHIPKDVTPTVSRRPPAAAAPPPAAATSQPARRQPAARASVSTSTGSASSTNPPMYREAVPHSRAVPTPTHRASSSASTPPAAVRCSGVTAKNERCKKMVRPTLADVVVYCSSHAPQTVAEPEPEIVEVKKEEPNARQRMTMARARSERRLSEEKPLSDGPGYVYFTSAEDPAHRPGFVFVKVGSTQQPHFMDRVGNGQQKCGFPEELHIFVNAWPNANFSNSLSNTTNKPTKLPNCRGIEKAIHELIRPKCVSALMGAYGKEKAHEIRNRQCHCQTTHREVYAFPLSAGKNAQYWEKLVGGIIDEEVEYAMTK